LAWGLLSIRLGLESSAIFLIVNAFLLVCFDTIKIGTLAYARKG
jgi:hypothetical protein